MLIFECLIGLIVVALTWFTIEVITAPVIDEEE